MYKQIAYLRFINAIADYTKTKSAWKIVQTQSKVLKDIADLFGEIDSLIVWYTTAQKATIHQVITMLSTSKNVIFPDHNHLLTTSTDNFTLIITLSVGSSVLVVSKWLWLWNRTFLEVASLVLTWRIMALLLSIHRKYQAQYLRPDFVARSCYIAHISGQNKGVSYLSFCWLSILGRDDHFDCLIHEKVHKQSFGT